MNLRKFCIIFTALFACALVGYAQVKIHGKIVDNEDKDLEFVTVRIAGTALGATSGLDGTYSLSVPQSDTIKVVFTCIGFKEVNRKLIDATGDVTLNVKMYPASYEIGEIEVTDIKKQTSQMQTIDASNVRLSPDATGGSVEAMLTTLAGVNSSNEMSSQYSVRGGTFDENSVYINGTEVYRPQLISSGQQEGLSIINPDMVGSIGFSTGGFGAE